MNNEVSEKISLPGERGLAMLPTNLILTRRRQEANGHEGRRMGNGFPHFHGGRLSVPRPASKIGRFIPYLVPKLCLGTPDRETLFRRTASVAKPCSRGRFAETEFRDPAFRNGVWQREARGLLGAPTSLAGTATIR